MPRCSGSSRPDGSAAPDGNAGRLQRRASWTPLAVDSLSFRKATFADDIGSAGTHKALVPRELLRNRAGRRRAPARSRPSLAGPRLPAAGRPGETGIPFPYGPSRPTEGFMSRLAIIRVDYARLIAIFAVLAAAWALVPPAHAADEPDLIFKKSTVFHWVSPNDKLGTYAVDDPEVDGVACHFTVPEKGGFKGWVGVAEEVSDISLACRQVGPIRFKEKFA